MIDLSKSKHARCPFRERKNIPHFPLPDVRPNLDFYLWVPLESITEDIAKEWKYERPDNEQFEWPTCKLLQTLLNHGHPETGTFYGGEATGSCHWKDVQTSFLRLMQDKHLHLNMYNLDAAYRDMAMSKRDEDPATEEVIILKEDLEQTCFWGGMLKERRCLFM